MTTPKPTAAEAVVGPASAPAGDGLPDAATLARWANELFGVVGTATPPASPLTPPAATPVLPAAASLPAGPKAPAAAAQARSPVSAALPAMSASPSGAAALPGMPVPELPRPFSPVGLETLRAADLRHPVLPVVPSLDVAPYPAFDAGAARSGSSDVSPLASGIEYEASRSPSAPTFYFLSVPAAPAVATPAATTSAAPGGGMAAPPARVGPGAPAPESIPAHRPFDVQSVRRDFPILGEKVHGRPLVWFDNAATTQKPTAVIERLSHFYRHENSNIHRAAHELAARATDAYEGARREAQRFLGAGSPEEIVFVRGATEAINLVAQSYGRKHVHAGDEILISHLEHHANIVPWQMLAREREATLKVVPVLSNGELDLESMQRLLSERTRIVSIAHVSNALGTVTPIEEIVALGHRAGALVMIDGAQSVSHLPIDVQALDADFFVFSGHKVFGPTGIGVLYAKSRILDSMPPWQGGGNMIEDVTFERTRYQPPPARFEAGTGNIADAVGLGAALSYLQSLGLHNVERYESELLAYATPRLEAVPGLTIIGNAPHKASVLSFVIDGLDPVTIGSALNQEGIAVRAGHHCAQPILRRFGHETTVRASLALYNTCQEVDAMVRVLHRLASPGVRRIR